MKIHELKTDSIPFKDVLIGRKTFEIRMNDRDFQVGDILHLRETHCTGQEMKLGAPLKYTGFECLVRVLHILEGQYGLKPGWCIMSIKILAP